ncbi:MAG: hypothetical protein KatS3mg015_2478 [Fimbriimonadales bacterium]|nr:MAG: hypothetical protein KatS3mg015_2478 [Fimbriimonadales bacterium]
MKRHHPDCDGLMTAHRVTFVQEGRGLAARWQAVCEECGPLHPGSCGSEESARNSGARTKVG